MYIWSITVITALNLIVLTLAKHVPQVNEEVAEQPQYIRTIRQIPKGQGPSKTQIWNFHSVPQPDRLKSQYQRQQQADLRNIKFGQKQDSEWKPFLPKYIPFKPIKKLNTKKTLKQVQDLHTASSDINEQKSTEEHVQYVYVQPQEEGPSDIQQLLVDAPANIQVQHNGSPANPQQFETLQKHVDAVNKAQEQQVLAEAQKQAEAHLQAQHEAIAIAQKQAQEAAYAKIAAHNQGLSTLQPQQEVSALQARPLEEVVANPLRHQYGGAYSSSEEDLRNAKPRIPHLPYLAAAPTLYNTKDTPQVNYSPVSPYTPHLVQESVSTPRSVVILQQPHQVVDDSQELVTADVGGHDDGHQYAAKYAFGYRILDEKHGNDYGHEEQREGKLTKGKYYVRLPDGRKQSVEYYADHSGYHARVSYENAAVHPYVPRPDVAHEAYVNEIPTVVHEK